MLNVLSISQNLKVLKCQLKLDLLFKNSLMGGCPLTSSKLFSFGWILYTLVNIPRDIKLIMRKTGHCMQVKYRIRETAQTFVLILQFNARQSEILSETTVTLQNLQHCHFLRIWIAPDILWAEMGRAVELLCHCIWTNNIMAVKGRYSAALPSLRG